MDLSLTYGSVLLGILGLAALIIITIFALRYMLAKNADSNLTEKYRDKKWSSPLTAFSKYPDVDGFKYTGILVKFGAVIALAATLLSFSATTFQKEFFIPDDPLEYEEIEQAPPRTAEPPPPPPPPPPPVIEEVPEEELLEEEDIEFQNEEVTAETEIPDAPVVEEKAPPPPPPPPPPPTPVEDEVFVIVEQNPRFPGCEDSGGSKDEKEACAKKKMLEYIYSNLKYPAIARENGIEGQVVIQFVVGKDGSIEDITLARGIGAGCDEAALSVVEGMNRLGKKWTPGKQRGKAVKVKYTLPVRFKLE